MKGGKAVIFKNSKTYDRLKWLASPGLPAVAALFGTISAILSTNNLPGALIFGVASPIIAAIATCLGEWTGQSSKKYWAAQQSGGDFSQEEKIDG